MKSYPIIVAFALAGCGAGQESVELESPKVQHTPPTAAPAEAEDEGEGETEQPECPVARSGVAVTTRELESGIAMTIVAEPARAEELRDLGRSIASMVQHREPETPATEEPPPVSPENPDVPVRPDLGEVPGDEPAPERPGVPGQPISEETAEPGELRGYAHGEDQPMDVDASIEDIDGGVEIVVNARDPGDVDRLREMMRAMADRLRAGECPTGLTE